LVPGPEGNPDQRAREFGLCVVLLAAFQLFDKTAAVNSKSGRCSATKGPILWHARQLERDC
jgi:hypothetical protein